MGGEGPERKAIRRAPSLIGEGIADEKRGGEKQGGKWQQGDMLIVRFGLSNKELLGGVGGNRRKPEDTALQGGRKTTGGMGRNSEKRRLYNAGHPQN